MASLATQGRDIKFDLGRMEGYRNFCNKLWNAARFVLMNTEGQACGQDRQGLSYTVADVWIYSRLQQVICEVDGAFAKYRFDEAATSLYHFLWGDFCDWYLEWIKPVLYGHLGEEEQIASRQTMLQVLEAALRLLHPLMPFITEELWQKVAPLAGIQQPIGSIMHAPWPQVMENLVNKAAEERMHFVQEVVVAVRTMRSETGIPPGKKLTLLVSGDAAFLDLHFRRHQQFILPLARLEAWQHLQGEAPAGCATAVLPQVRLFIPLQGVIDLVAEQARLNKEMQRIEADLQRVRGKLTNPKFLSHAKAEIVEKERHKERELQEKHQGIHTALQRIEQGQTAGRAS